MDPRRESLKQWIRPPQPNCEWRLFLCETSPVCTFMKRSMETEMKDWQCRFKDDPVPIWYTVNIHLYEEAETAYLNALESAAATVIPAEPPPPYETECTFMVNALPVRLIVENEHLPPVLRYDPTGQKMTMTDAVWTLTKGKYTVTLTFE